MKIQVVSAFVAAALLSSSASGAKVKSNPGMCKSTDDCTKMKWTNYECISVQSNRPEVTDLRQCTPGQGKSCGGLKFGHCPSFTSWSQAHRDIDVMCAIFEPDNCAGTKKNKGKKGTVDCMPYTDKVTKKSHNVIYRCVDSKLYEDESEKSPWKKEIIQNLDSCRGGANGDGPSSTSSTDGSGGDSTGTTSGSSNNSTKSTSKPSIISSGDGSELAGSSDEVAEKARFLMAAGVSGSGSGGSKIEVNSRLCNGHGTCAPVAKLSNKFRCICYVGYEGKYCQKVLSNKCSIPGQCGVKGNCDVSDNTCKCGEGYTGDQCAKCKFGSAKTCNRNGECQKDGKCKCKATYYGDNCESKKKKPKKKKSKKQDSSSTRLLSSFAGILCMTVAATFY